MPHKLHGYHLFLLVENPLKREKKEKLGFKMKLHANESFVSFFIQSFKKIGELFSRL
jgi:hypothetical protein